jgi:hypothetical protein
VTHQENDLGIAECSHRKGNATLHATGKLSIRDSTSESAPTAQATNGRKTDILGRAVNQVSEVEFVKLLGDSTGKRLLRQACDTEPRVEKQAQYRTPKTITSKRSVQQQMLVGRDVIPEKVFLRTDTHDRLNHARVLVDGVAKDEGFSE